LSFGAIYLNFGAIIENRVFSRGVGGGWVGPPGPPGGFGIGVGKKYYAHPLELSLRKSPRNPRNTQNEISHVPRTVLEKL